MRCINMFLFFVYCLAFSKISLGQPDTLWTKSIGGIADDKANFIEQTLDKGFIIVGQTESFGVGNDDIYIIRTDENGDTLWTKTYGESGWEEGHCIRQTEDDGFIIAGAYTSISQGYDATLIKINSIGDTVWTRRYGRTGDDKGIYVDLTNDGGYILTGQSEINTPPYIENVWLVKTDSHGDTLWTKSYGNTNFSKGHVVRQTSDLGYIILAEHQSNNTEDDKIILIKTDANGDTLWTKIYGGVDHECGYSLKITKDGGYIVVGETQSFKNGIDKMYVIRTDSNGDSLWTRVLGGWARYVGYSVEIADDNDYILAGIAQLSENGVQNVFLTRINDNGDSLWAKIYTSDNFEIARCISATEDGGFIIAGLQFNFNKGDEDVFLMKLGVDPFTRIPSIKSGILYNYVLHQNFPNPFNPSTSIKFTLPKSEFVELKVFNILGKEVSILISKKLNQGNHTYTFDGNNLASGIYYYQLVAGDFKEVKKMILLR